MTAGAAPDPIRFLLQQWRDDPAATYRNWFLWDQRLKNFRSIRRGLEVVVNEIADGRFGNVYKGSSLETVVGSIAEQRQIFRGADHAFLWKPKLRIPDIYEDSVNQRAFGDFLNVCCCSPDGRGVLDAIHRLDARKIKGLGPAAANLLYFVHPTVVPPFNTAIVRGYNAVTGARVKLGKWSDYIAMREGVLRLNETYRDVLPNDLGAIGGFLFDVGSGRYPAPPLRADGDALAQWEADVSLARQQAAAASPAAAEPDLTHAQMQAWLRDLGRALGFEVWIAANDQGRVHEGGRLADGCATALPRAIEESPAADIIRLIDVLWIEGERIAAAFEVEHTTSIYSGIVRLLDLALGTHGVGDLFIVAPDKRESDVRAQLQRPAFRAVADLRVRYLPYGRLEEHREAISRFGSGLKPINAIAVSL